MAEAEGTHTVYGFSVLFIFVVVVVCFQGSGDTAQWCKSAWYVQDSEFRTQQHKKGRRKTETEGGRGEGKGKGKRGRKEE